MPRFQVLLTGDGLDLARAKLNEANIPTMGPTFAPISDPDGDRIGHEMLAVLDAATPEDAEDRIRTTLPLGIYRIGSTTPGRPPASPSTPVRLGRREVSNGTRTRGRPE